MEVNLKTTTATTQQFVFVNISVEQENKHNWQDIIK